MFGGVVFKVAWTLSEVRNRLSTWEDWIQHDGGAVVSYKLFLSESFVKQYFSMSCTKQKDMVKLFQLEKCAKVPVKVRSRVPQPSPQYNMSQLSVRWSPTANSWSYFYFSPLTLKHTESTTGCRRRHFCNFNSLWPCHKLRGLCRGCGLREELAFRFHSCMFCVWEYNKRHRWCATW